MEFFNEWVLPHWPWFAAAIIFGAIGVAMKSVVTPKVAERNKFAWWFRATLPLHPILSGVVIGASGLLPTSLGDASWPASALYYGAAGAMSSWVYNAFTHFMEKRTSKGAPKSLSVPPPVQR